MKLVVGHLYPEYLNIYADRGNIAVLARRAAWRGIELELRPIGIGDATQLVGDADGHAGSNYTFLTLTHKRNSHNRHD